MTKDGINYIEVEEIVEDLVGKPLSGRDKVLEPYGFNNQKPQGEKEADLLKKPPVSIFQIRGRCLTEGRCNLGGGGSSGEKIFFSRYFDQD